MSKFLFRLLVQFQVIRRDPERADPFLKSVDPFLMDRRRILRPDKILHLHLLELACSENEISRRDLIAKRFSDLCNSERKFPARGVEHIREIDKDPLRRFGS